MLHFHDPLLMPGTAEPPGPRLARATALPGTVGAAYVERRGIPVEVAEAAGVRFDADFNGRPALLMPLTGRFGELASLHGRYLHVVRGENKMLTVGPGGGVIEVLEGWRAEPLILVEGLFDALSLAVCGFSCVATIGRWAPWLPDISRGRVVWLAFDTGRPGESEFARYRARLGEARTKRLLPPPLCKDWNTALVKRGASVVTRWLRDRTAGGDRES